MCNKFKELPIVSLIFLSIFSPLSAQLHWEPDSTIPSKAINGVLYSVFNRFVIVGVGDSLCLSDDGTHWNFYPVNALHAPHSLKAIQGSVYGITKRGTLVRSNDTAKSWQNVITPDSVKIDFIAGDSSRILLLSKLGIICMSTNRGKSWQTQKVFSSPYTIGENSPAPLAVNNSGAVLLLWDMVLATRDFQNWQECDFEPSTSAVLRGNWVTTVGDRFLLSSGQWSRDPLKWEYDHRILAVDEGLFPIKKENTLLTISAAPMRYPSQISFDGGLSRHELRTTVFPQMYFNTVVIGGNNILLAQGDMGRKSGFFRSKLVIPQLTLPNDWTEWGAIRNVGDSILLQYPDEEFYRWDPQLSKLMREAIHQNAHYRYSKGAVTLSANNQLFARYLSPSRVLSIFSESHNKSIGEIQLNIGELKSAALQGKWSPILQDYPENPLVEVTVGDQSDTLWLVLDRDGVPSNPFLPDYYDVRNPRYSIPVANISTKNWHIDLSAMKLFNEFGHNLLLKRDAVKKWIAESDSQSWFQLHPTVKEAGDESNGSVCRFTAISLVTDTSLLESDRYSKAMKAFCGLLSEGFLVREDLAKKATADDSVRSEYPFELNRWIDSSYRPKPKLLPIDSSMSEFERKQIKIKNQIEILRIQKLECPNKGISFPAYKPIIYCYPTDTTDLTVKLTFPQGGKVIYTYPTYPDSGWNVTAFPDGRLLDKQGKSYYSLFWEGTVPVEVDNDSGFVVHRDSLNAFFERTLDSLGLNYKEKQEFIVYWAPKLMENEYTFIHFSRKNYAQSAKLEITPMPTTVNRFLMLYRKADGLEKVTPQKFENPGRKGFVVVEWGGAELVEGGSCEIK